MISRLGFYCKSGSNDLFCGKGIYGPFPGISLKDRIIRGLALRDGALRLSFSVGCLFQGVVLRDKSRHPRRYSSDYGP